MKNLKITVLVGLLAVSSFAFGMNNELSELRDTIEILRENLRELQIKFDDQTIKIAALEEAAATGAPAPAVVQEVSFKKCNGEVCKGITSRKFQHLRGKPLNKKRNLYICRGNKCAPVTAGQHNNAQAEFKALQEKLGVSTPASKMNEIRTIRRGIQGTQKRFNAVRSELNRLLSQDNINEADLQLINQKINELERLNPARWPKPEDYRELLERSE